MTDAPKIDTQAPERIWASPEHDGENDYGGFWIKARVAPSVEYERRDLADARAAAAWLAGIDALLDRVGDLPISEIAADEVIYAAKHLTPPTDATALDRLLEAARQDERTAIAAYIGMSPSEVTDRQYHMEAIRTGLYRDDPLMQRGGRMEGGDG